MFPEVFRRRLVGIVGEQAFDAILERLQVRAECCFRIQRSRLGEDEDADSVIRRLRQDGLEVVPLPWLDRMFTLPASQRRQLVDHPLTRDGRIYIQNPSSLMAVLALDPQPGEEVLDMCAAPGGKTLAIVDAMDGKGRVAAVEAVRGRFFKLRHMMQVHGADIVQCYQADSRQLWRKVPERFDRILLDAPCSSEARIRGDDPEAWRFWSDKKSREMSRKQAALIRSAFDCLKPGGVLLYCTCTYAPEENELIVQSLLDRHGERLSIEKLCLPCPETMPGLASWQGQELNADMNKSVRVLPSRYTDAFFLCRLRKLG